MTFVLTVNAGKSKVDIFIFRNDLKSVLSRFDSAFIFDLSIFGDLSWLTLSH